ncbi:ABC-type antimicrobial peptide transport system permease subunit [Algoriphagus sp. 4150]|uniref:ABC transporter permease n=1 Tax=Algoriphagus sp. 4150 TaxID=2817756 RepID=UPI00285F9B13|nr:ABC transporter permease [Algoriphagus sp. 4150]MDR7131462.1 ABC-type antimicrobial peptide transport system permease subunit [Algoriphagus sp. 4150]
MKMQKPPKWADKFLAWYCRPDLLDEIQGDIYELYDRKVGESKRAANWQFVWNVIRFFRIKNIKKRSSKTYSNAITAAMLKNNLTVFLRSFRRNPGHSLLSLFGLSIAFACTFLIVLWVNNEMSYDKFNKDSENLYKVITHIDANDSYQTQFTAGFNIDVSSVPEVEEVTHISTGTRWPHELCFWPETETGECVYFSGVYASPGLFSTFTFPILSGDPDPLKDVAQIAISDKMAKTLYGEESPLGKIIKIDGSKEVSIAAVFQDIPSQSSIKFDFALPFSIYQRQTGISDERLQSWFFDVYLKTVSNVDAGQLSGKLNNPAVIGGEYLSKKMAYEAVPFTEWHLNNTYENGKATGGRIDYVRLFILIALLVLVMAVINFVNLSTAKATLRAKEIGVRKAIGAVKSSLVAQFMSESFVMVLAAFLLGIGWTVLGLPIFNNIIGDSLSLSLIGGMNVVYLLIFMVVVALLAGLYPSLVLSSFQSAGILKGASNFNGSLNIRKVLMAVQICLSLGIILFSSVIYFQLDFIRQKNLGFDRENMIRLEPSYRLLKSYDAFKSETLRSDAVTDMTAANANPMVMDNNTLAVDWAGKSPDSQISFQTIGALANFSELFGLQVLEGRSFLAEKLTKDSLATEALITETAAAYFGFENPIGEKIRIHDYLDCEIVGVVNDLHTSSLKESIQPLIIYRSPIEYLPGIYIKYRNGEAQKALEAISVSYKLIEPDLLLKYWFQDETFDNLYKTESIASNLVLAFSMISIIIAIIGIVGLATFNTLRKTKEIGVRRVFGATAFESLLVLVKEFVWVVMIALLVAVPVAWVISQKWLQSYAYRTQIPWVTFGLIVLAAVLLIMGVIWIQSQKTITTNPTKSLRSE